MRFVSKGISLTIYGPATATNFGYGGAVGEIVSTTSYSGNVSWSTTETSKLARQFNEFDSELSGRMNSNIWVFELSNYRGSLYDVNRLSVSYNSKDYTVIHQEQNDREKRLMLVCEPKESLVS